MSGVTPNEGKEIIANLIYKGSDGNRGTNLQLGLFTNSSGLSETSILTNITEPSGGSYARKTLTDGSWSTTDGDATYPKQTFTASGSDYSANIYGWFIATTGTSPKMLHFKILTNGPYTVTNGKSVEITPEVVYS